MEVEHRVSPISKKSLGEAVAAVLEERIVSGYYSPGERLLEDQLANELEISRPSLRDGLLILKAKDLVVREPNRLTRVIDFTPKKIEDIYAIRSALETFSIDIIRDKKLSVDPLQNYIALADFPIGDRSEESVFEIIKNADIKFHETLIEIAGNQYCMQMWDTLRNQLLMLYSQILKNDRHRFNILNFSLNHRDIYLNLKNCNFEKAKEEVRQHIIDNTSLLV